MPTDAQLNDFAADIMRAELMGDDDEVDELKKKLEKARKRKAAGKTSSNSSQHNPQQQQHQQKQHQHQQKPSQSHEEDKAEEHNVLMRLNKDGTVAPARGVVVERDRQAISGKVRRIKGKADTHVDGERTRYFDDDDKNSDLAKMIEREKSGLDDNPDMIYNKFSSNFMDKTNDDDYTLDDMFVDRIAKKQSKGKHESRERDAAVHNHQQMAKALDHCKKCFENRTMDKHLIVSLGEKVYMAIPERGSLAPGHCVLLPVRHSIACTSLDEDVFEEMKVFKENLVKMWKAEEKDVIFFESVLNLRKQYHTVVHCVPLTRDEGEFAPMIFKKAILECDTQWSQNKKLIDTREKGLRRSVPKGFPYFSVEFEMGGGFAHVVEDETLFPRHFGQEILGNILDVPPRTWLNPKKERFEDQKRIVMAFSKKWADYDWTTMLDV